MRAGLEIHDPARAGFVDEDPVDDGIDDAPVATVPTARARNGRRDALGSNSQRPRSSASVDSQRRQRAFGARVRAGGVDDRASASRDSSRRETGQLAVPLASSAPKRSSASCTTVPTRLAVWRAQSNSITSSSSPPACRSLSARRARRRAASDRASRPAAAGAVAAESPRLRPRRPPTPTLVTSKPGMSAPIAGQRLWSSDACAVRVRDRPVLLRDGRMQYRCSERFARVSAT